MSVRDGRVVMERFISDSRSPVRSAAGEVLVTAWPVPLRIAAPGVRRAFILLTGPKLASGRHGSR